MTSPSSAWHGPAWALPALLATLSMLGPFAIDTYLPAFEGITKALQASPLHMQQTLSAYLLAFAFMNLFHGALADSFGRRPVVLWGVGVFSLASVGCALAQSVEQLIALRALQGLSAGASMVVSRAIIRDIFPPVQAQRVMSQVTLFFGLAPAVAPIVGGWLYALLDWHSIFWFMALLSGSLWLINWRMLPETLPTTARQPFAFWPLFKAYCHIGASGRFLLLAITSAVPFNSMFIYILAAPEFLGTQLQLPPTQFFWMFLCTVGGVMLGAFASGRLADKMPPKRQIRTGLLIMAAATLINLAIALSDLRLPVALIAPLGLLSLGWAIMMPPITLLVLDLHPSRRGLVSSMQACMTSAFNGLVAGAIVPLVAHTQRLDPILAMALTSGVFWLVGVLAWVYVHARWPSIGRHVAG